MKVQKVNRNADVWIEETSIPYQLSIQEVAETGAARRFTLNVDKVEEGVARLLHAVNGMEPDIIIASVSILFINMVWHLSLKISSVLRLAENYLNSGEKKPACLAMRMYFQNDVAREISRSESLKLPYAVNATAVLNGTWRNPHEGMKLYY